MNLIQIRYGEPPKFALILYLGSKDGKTHGIKTMYITDQEISDIKAKLSALKNLDLDGRIKWMKVNCPKGYKLGYRSYNTSKCKIIKQIELT